ncbi:MAG TPA: caspase family protein, partial [Chitinophagaceae bacterium]|nr:caspase family protein [Chitinophagaceae bacterium]
DNSGNTQTYNYKYKIDTDKTFVLLIGVGKFNNDFHPIPPVQGNLEDFYKLLTNKKHIGIPRENILVSFNESHVEIQKHLLQAGRRQDIQTLFIYFAGHGHRTDIKKLSLIAADTEKIGDEIIGGIDFEFISGKVMKNSVATQKILILDTCHSGIATQGADDVIRDFDVKGSYILTSSPGDDVSYFEKDARHTFFTGALIDVLENGIDNTNDMLALEDLYEYAKEVLSEKKFPHPNAKNELNIPPSDFFIARNPSFSTEKLKWRAYNLRRDGKLEEALDEMRKLMKRFPEDETLRKEFVECETELSFSRLVNEANAFFYQKKNFKQAVLLYKKAYDLKKDAMVMEKIRQCEEENVPKPPLDRLALVKGNPNYQAFQKAMERRAFYTAYQYLKKVKQLFPENEYVKDEFFSLENNLRKFADGKSDDRLVNYFYYLEKGNLADAMTELKIQISSDPEFPPFLQLQRGLQRRIKDEMEGEKEEKDPVLFRVFETLGRKGKIIVLSVLVLSLIAVLAFYMMGSSKKTFSELRDLLATNADKAIPLLQKEAEKNDSAKLLLGDYYRDMGIYVTAASWYHEAQLPAAKSALGKMYYSKQMSDFVDTVNAKFFFERALFFGTDTTASTGLGIIALNRYNSPKNIFQDKSFDKDSNWTEAKNNFEEGYKNGSIICRQMLGKLYFDLGKSMYADKSYQSAYDYYTDAIQYQNSDAMVYLGFMFTDATWEKHNSDSSNSWYRNAIQYKNPMAYNNYANYLIRNSTNDPANIDSAYDLLMQGKVIAPSASRIYFNLAEVFQTGGYKIYRNRDSVVYYYKIAADKGIPAAKDSLLKLGVTY